MASANNAAAAAAAAVEAAASLTSMAVLASMVPPSAAGDERVVVQAQRVDAAPPSPSGSSALGKRERKPIHRFDPQHAEEDQRAQMAQRKALVKLPDPDQPPSLLSDHFFALFLRRHVLVWKRAVNCSLHESDWQQALEGLVTVAKTKGEYVVYNGYELDNGSMTSKCLMLVKQRDFKDTVVDLACQESLKVFKEVLGMEVVEESGCGALVTFSTAGSLSARAHTKEEPRQAHHYDWHRTHLRTHKMRAGTILFNPSSSPAKLTMAQPVESQTQTPYGQKLGFVASGARLMVTIPAMGAVFFDDLVWHAGVRYESLDWHLRCHYYLLQRPGGRTSEKLIPKGVNFRNVDTGAAASAAELHDGEGYPSASKTFAEPQEELEQQSALGPACDVASLGSLLLDLEVAM